MTRILLIKDENCALLAGLLYNLLFRVVSWNFNNPERGNVMTQFPAAQFSLSVSFVYIS